MTVLFLGLIDFTSGSIVSSLTSLSSGSSDFTFEFAKLWSSSLLKRNFNSFLNNKKPFSILFGPKIESKIKEETIEAEVKSEEPEESEVKEEKIEAEVKSEEPEESEVKEEKIESEVKSIKSKRRVVKDEIIDIEVNSDKK